MLTTFVFNDRSYIIFAHTAVLTVSTGKLFLGLKSYIFTGMCVNLPCVSIEGLPSTDGLSPCGIYYEGYTNDLQQKLTKLSSATVSTYGVCYHIQTI